MYNTDGLPMPMAQRYLMFAGVILRSHRAEYQTFVALGIADR